MQPIRLATTQFEARDGDKEYNLARMEALAAEAAAQGAELVCFHECAIPGYTYLETLDRDALAALAEPLDASPSLERLRRLAARLGVGIGAGLVEIDDDRLYNTWALVDADGVVARHRKIHAFISPHLDCGDSFTVFDWRGSRFGILICYDCNLPENVRMNALEGVEILLAPHVTGCLPSPMPGRGVVEPAVWEAREADPVRCRQEFDGPKGRGWLMRWLPARAFENGLYLVYANPIGVEGGTIKPGGSLILDPYGEILAECRRLGDEVVTALCDPAKLESAPGRSYIDARRPELYGRMLAPNPKLRPDGKPDVWWQRQARAKSA
ncbi:MAG: nitrilase [Acidobacteria bacterium]|nr:nitrilase [Acidobacteriota bacterium]